MTVLAFVIGVVVLIVGLAISIALHELGHLLPAKAFGVRVGQYMIGFGPTLWSRRRGETEYGFKALPLGGFISMAGMYPPATDGEGARRPSRLFGALVQDARDANAETLIGVQEGRTFYGLSVWKRIVIMVGGPFMNLVLALVLFTVAFSGIGLQTATSSIASVAACTRDGAVAECDAGATPSPAAAAGLEAGDRIVSIDGDPVSDFADAYAVVQASPGKTLQFVVERDGQDIAVPVTPVASPQNGAGFVGMTSRVEYVPQPLWDGPAAAFDQLGRVVEIMAQFPVKVYQAVSTVFSGAERDADGPLSPVGAGRLAGELAASDAPILNRVSSIVLLLGALNIALFVFNLIPLLPLDGGHIAVALYDGVKRLLARLRGRGRPAPTDASALAPVALLVVVVLGVAGAGLVLADLVNPVQLL